MPSFRLHHLAVLLAMGWMPSGWAADLALPPITGQLSGNLVLHDWPGLPPLAWRVTSVAEGVGTRLELSTTAPGLVLRIEAALPSEKAAGTWRVAEGAVDVPAWLPVVMARAGPVGLPGDLEAGGRVRLAGSGTWQGAEVRGTVSATLVDGSARSSSQGWEAAAIAVTGELTVSAQGAGLRSARIRVGSFQAAGMVASNLTADVAGAADGRLEIRRLELDVLGGHVSLEPFGFDPAKPALEATANFSGIALSDLARLVPQALAEARGLVNGRVALRWSSATGFQLGTGALAVSTATPAMVRLAATPGFLTGSMPRNIALLPAWLGPLARWFSPENPAYSSLEDIELGRQALSVESLNLQFYPDGPDAPRSARVDLTARPPAGSAVERVTFTVNVAGPLNQVLRLGRNGGIKVKVESGP